MKIAFYKSPKTWLDKGIRFFSKSPYSHCEIILGEYAYSSSGRDGGKRRKSISGMNLKDRSKWDVYNVNLGDIDKEKLEERLNELHEDIPNCGYDFASVILYHMLRIPFNNKKKYICSEYCYWLISMCTDEKRSKRLDNFNYVYFFRHPYKLNPSNLFILLKMTRILGDNDF